MQTHFPWAVEGFPSVCLKADECPRHHRTFRPYWARQLKKHESKLLRLDVEKISEVQGGEKEFFHHLFKKKLF